MAVAVDLSEVSDLDAKRLVDFAAGTVFNAKGTIERVDFKIFLLSHTEPPDEGTPARRKVPAS